MSGHTPWNEIKWAKANVELGLKRDEICPGLTLDQHAESLAMFEQSKQNYTNKVWKLAIPVVAQVIRKKLLAPDYLMEEDIDTLARL